MTKIIYATAVIAALVVFFVRSGDHEYNDHVVRTTCGGTIVQTERGLDCQF